MHSFSLFHHVAVVGGQYRNCNYQPAKRIDPGLNFDPDVGPVLSPLLLWGPYLWAAGLNPRSDGLTWARSDLSPSDGTHPSETGQQKVAGILLDFFKTNELARSWFVHSP